MTAKESKDFLEEFTGLIHTTTDSALQMPNNSSIHKFLIGRIEGCLYTNLIVNFKKNLTQDNLEAIKVKKEECRNMERKFAKVFHKCEISFKNPDKFGEINKKFYEEFRENLKKISKTLHKFLLDLEKVMKLNSCEKLLNEFKKDIDKLGKELRVTKIANGFGVQIGFE